MSTILIKDSLRKSIEAASGGAQTVIYTAKNQPTFMNIVEKYDLSTIDPSLSGIHPAFIINGVVKDVIYVGTYSGVVKNGEFLSLPNEAPAHSLLDFAGYVANVRLNGAGHHIMTAQEWSAISLKTYKDGTQPLGNTYYGRSSDDSTQYGRRVDGLSAMSGITTGIPHIFTGSGPVSFRHNRKYNGISDLAGNIRELCAGVRMVKKEIQVFANNDAAMLNADLSATSASWKAIDAVTGEFITPDGNGTTYRSIKYDATGTADYTIVVPNGYVGSGVFGNLLNTGVNPVSTVALNKLKALALFPLVNNAATSFGNDGFSLANLDETIVSMGGTWGGTTTSGIFSTSFVDRTRKDNSITARPAYYTP